MEMQSIVEMISSMGFPIVMCGALFWKMHKQDLDHKAEMEKISEALNNNTKVIAQLLEHFQA